MLGCSQSSESQQLGTGSCSSISKLQTPNSKCKLSSAALPRIGLQNPAADTARSSVLPPPARGVGSHRFYQLFNFSLIHYFSSVKLEQRILQQPEGVRASLPALIACVKLLLREAFRGVKIHLPGTGRGSRILCKDFCLFSSTDSPQNLGESKKSPLPSQRRHFTSIKCFEILTLRKHCLFSELCVCVSPSLLSRAPVLGAEELSGNSNTESKYRERPREPQTPVSTVILMRLCLILLLTLLPGQHKTTGFVCIHSL